MSEFTTDGTRQEAMPSNYSAVFGEVKRRLHESRYRVQRVVNAELIHLYWQIGKTLVIETASQGWGGKVLDRLSSDLKAEFPGTTGFSVTNLKYMRSFAETWPDETSIGPQLVDQLPWGHVRVLVSSFNDAELPRLKTLWSSASATPLANSARASPTWGGKFTSLSQATTST
ncbi:DUF1016 N-terminal domain-containing protein [Subtercola lobariae]|uniref:YhcG N-terminal domain-containing protein n=1 Tax=Subtercola lobariae TaxID=1588641 RepID=A0A917EVK1_9MICO|nr:DUF1016 N-terminal domain-containing protein [Subtercola lobariae]GGF11733.1 hypothetical protein GCM10011399_01990 [Subtercola lobariae]